MQTSSGYAVPFYDYQRKRDTLIRWADKKGDEGIKQYWEEKNQFSIDGKPPHILDDSL